MRKKRETRSEGGRERVSESERACVRERDNLNLVYFAETRFRLPESCRETEQIVLLCFASSNQYIVVYVYVNVHVYTYSYSIVLLEHKLREKIIFLLLFKTVLFFFICGSFSTVRLLDHVGCQGKSGGAKSKNFSQRQQQAFCVCNYSWRRRCMWI